MKCVIQDTFLNLLFSLLHVFLYLLLRRITQRLFIGVLECFIVFTRHVEDKMIVYLLIHFLNFTWCLWIPAQTGRIIRPIFHHYLRMLFQMFLVSTEIVIPASMFDLNRMKVSRRNWFGFRNIYRSWSLWTSLFLLIHVRKILSMRSSLFCIYSLFLLNLIWVHNG